MSADAQLSPGELWELIEHLNRQFDYGEDGERLEFWLNMLESQVHEARDHLENGREDKALNECADGVFVAVQALMMSDEDHREVIRRRAEDVIGRVDSIQPKYQDTNGHRVGFTEVAVPGDESDD